MMGHADAEQGWRVPFHVEWSPVVIRISGDYDSRATHNSNTRGLPIMSIYQQYDVGPIINATGSVTRLGGAPMPPEVIQAFGNAANEFVSLEELHAAASRRIARQTGAEAGLVTAGSAAALTLGAAAILAGNDLGRMERLPDCTGFPHEFVIAREQRSGYDHAVRAAGAKLVEVGFNEIVAGAGVRRTEAWEYENAFSEQTAGILYVAGPDSQPPLADLAAVAKRHDIAVLVDAAGELPPRENLRTFISAGADLVAFSGGKGIRGPQSTGILCGRHALIASAALQMLDMDDHPQLWDPPEDFIDKRKFAGIPRHGIGRALKVSKEEIVALLTALDLFASGAYEVDLPRFGDWLQTIAQELAGCPVECRIETAGEDQRPPLLEIHLEESALGRTAFQVCRELRTGDPPIYVGHGRLSQGVLTVNPFCLSEPQIASIAQALREALTP